MAEINLSGNILILTQWSFKDALVQTYTLPYVELIRSIISPERKIIVVTSEQPQLAMEPNEKTVIQQEWSNRNMQLIALTYRHFGVKKLFSVIGQLSYLYKIIKREKIEVIHAFCTPAGSFAYFLSKLTNTKLIIDSYEPHAESMVENGTWKKTGIAFRILFALEKKMSQRATAVIATTDGMRIYAKEKYGVVIKHFYVKPACVDTDLFFPREKDAVLMKKFQLENKVVAVYAGKLGGIYYKEEVFDFIKACYDYWSGEFCFLMLTNATRDEIENEMKRVGLPTNSVISQFVFHQDIPQYLSLGDFAINPVKPVPTKRYCTSIKDGEYWAMGLPVVISPNISDDSGIISENKIGVVFDFKDKIGLSTIMNDIDSLLKINNYRELKQKIWNFAIVKREFSIAEKIYKILYS